MAPMAPAQGVLGRFAALLFSRWLKEGLQALFLVVLARRSAPTFGEFVLALEVGAVVLLATEFGLNVALVRRLHEGPREAAAVLGQVSCLKAVLLSLVWLVVAGFVFWQDYPPSLRQVVLLIGMGVGLEALASTFFTFLQVEGRQAAEGKIRAAAAALGVGYAFLALALDLPGVWVALFKIWESLANLLGVFLWVCRRGTCPWRRPHGREVWQVFRQGLSFGLLAVLSALLSRVNLLFLQHYGGTGQVAQYGAAWPLVDGLHAIVSGLLLQAVLYPVFVRLTADDPRELSRLAHNAGRWLLGVALLIMLALAMEGNRVIPLLFGPQYPEAVGVLRILVFCVPFLFFQSLSGFILLSLHQERLLVLMFAGGLLFNLLFCAVVMPARPLTGAALAMVLSRALVTTAATLAAHRRIRLLSGRQWGRLLGATALGWGLYLALSGLLPRELAELVGLLPLAGEMRRRPRGED